MQHNVYQQYKSHSLKTLTRQELVIKLFDEASKQVSMAIFLINRNDIPKAYNSIAKAQKIISTLNFSLDMKYAISIELRDMYQFLFDKLSEAIVNKDIGLMKKLLHLIDDLKNTFKQADKLARSERA